MKREHSGVRSRPRRPHGPPWRSRRDRGGSGPANVIVPIQSASSKRGSPLKSLQDPIAIRNRKGSQSLRERKVFGRQRRRSWHGGGIFRDV